MTLFVKKRIDYYFGGLLLFILKPFVVLLGKVLRRDHSLSKVRKIGFIKMLGGGSLVIAYPSLLGIRKKHPEARLVLITTPPIVPFAEALGIFDEIIAIDDSSPFRSAADSARALVATFRIDALVDLEVHSRLTTVFSVLTCARNRIGFYLEQSFWRRHVSTHLIFFNRFSGAYEFYDHVAALLGAAPAPREDCARRIFENLPPTASAPAGCRRIGVGHACSDLGKERMLAPHHWAAALDDSALKDEDEVHFLGAAIDADSARAARHQLRARRPRIRQFVHCGELTLVESLSLLRGMDEFRGIDSALLHFARLFGLHCVSYWGPTDPSTLLRPFPDAREQIVYEKIACSPCIHVAEAPPCRGDNVCIRRLFDAAERGKTSPFWIIDT